MLNTYQLLSYDCKNERKYFNNGCMVAYGPSLANREKHLPDKLIKDLASHGELEIRLSDSLKQIKLIPLFVPIFIFIILSGLNE